MDGDEVPGKATSEPLLVELLDVQLELPWDLEFLPDDSILVTQQRGEVKHVRDGETRLVLQLQPFVAVQTGLLGLAVDPAFTSNRFVYLYYTYARDEQTDRHVFNRISRFTFTGQQLEAETILLNAIPGSFDHSGGRLEFGPDGKLYATTGDADRAFQTADIEFLGGKVLRMNTDGSPPADNPHPGSLVYSRGHRNPQGMAWRPDTDELFTSEHGPIRDDEINRVEPGNDYGWGKFACRKRWKAEGLGKLLVLFGSTGFGGWNGYPFPGGLCRDVDHGTKRDDFRSGEGTPWFDSLFVATLRGSHLRRYRFSESSEPILFEVFLRRSDASCDGCNASVGLRLRDVEFHEGSLYVIGQAKGLVRISPRGL